jgi:hypothetical protein
MKVNKLTIFGSRTLTDNRVSEIINNAIEKHKPEVILTSGETAGVCEVARKIAAKKAITLTLKFANNEKYAAGKYASRCEQILKESDFVVFIHDGVSKGTKNEITMAKKMKIPFDYHELSLIDEDDEHWPESNLEW